MKVCNLGYVNAENTLSNELNARSPQKKTVDRKIKTPLTAIQIPGSPFDRSGHDFNSISSQPYPTPPTYDPIPHRKLTPIARNMGILPFEAPPTT